MDYKKLANDYINKKLTILVQAWNRTMLTNKQGQKLIKTIERLHLKKQLNDDQPIKKYSVHVTLWGEETHREKWKHLIMKRKEHTATMRLSKEQITHLKSLGEDENIGNYDGDYKLIKNGSEEYDEVLDLMDEEDKIYYQQLASLIEYISLDEFVHVKVKKYNLLKNNLKSELSETINNKAIDYKGKTLQELIKSNQLPRKFKNDACVYNTLIQMYDGMDYEDFDKCLTYEQCFFMIFQNMENNLNQSGDPIYSFIDDYLEIIKDYDCSSRLIDDLVNKCLEEKPLESYSKIDVFNEKNFKKLKLAYEKLYTGYLKLYDAYDRFSGEGTKIQVDETVIELSDTLNAYWEMAKSCKMAETTETEFYVNCSAETMNKLLDVILTNKYETDDKTVLALSGFLCIDIKYEPTQNEIDKIQKKIDEINNYIGRYNGQLFMIEGKNQELDAKIYNLEKKINGGVEVSFKNNNRVSKAQLRNDFYN
eukprot:gene8456-281_t